MFQFWVPPQETPATGDCRSAATPAQKIAHPKRPPRFGRLRCERRKCQHPFTRLDNVDEIATPTVTGSSEEDVAYRTFPKLKDSTVTDRDESARGAEAAS
jgi:hypothetical protein